jgi:hypothetical protein
MEWRQIDFEGGEGRLDPGTTKKQGRVFPMSAALRRVLGEPQGSSEGRGSSCSPARARRPLCRCTGRSGRLQGGRRRRPQPARPAALGDPTDVPKGNQRDGRDAALGRQDYERLPINPLPSESTAAHRRDEGEPLACTPCSTTSGANAAPGWIVSPSRGAAVVRRHSVL